MTRSCMAVASSSRTVVARPETSVTARLVYAQRVIDRHAYPRPRGWCRTCRHPGPCIVRKRAEAVFEKAGRLPRLSRGALHLAGVRVLVGVCRGDEAGGPL